jgi:hypothetical protein
MAKREDPASQALVRFLKSLRQSPVETFAKLYLGEKLPAAFRDPLRVEVIFQFKTPSGAKVDIALKSGIEVLCVEVKVGDVEHLGQYLKYEDSLSWIGAKSHLGGLINSPGSDWNEVFMRRIPRLYWSEVLSALSREFGKTREFKRLIDDLYRISPEIGINAPSRRPELKPSSDLGLLSTVPEALCKFYGDLADLVPCYAHRFWQDGNSPFEIHFGKREWTRLFQEHNCRRIALGLNQPSAGKLFSEPYFAFSVHLWNKGFFSNLDWFTANAPVIAAHFRRRGFQVIRNFPGKWSPNVDWSSPYSANGFRYANAFHEPIFTLRESEYLKISWNQALERLHREFERVSRAVDALQAILE